MAVMAAVMAAASATAAETPIIILIAAVAVGTNQAVGWVGRPLLAAAVAGTTPTRKVQRRFLTAR